VIERSAVVLAVEAPIVLVYHGVPHVVLLATSADLEETVYCEREDTDEAWGFEYDENVLASGIARGEWNVKKSRPVATIIPSRRSNR
jgi:formate dehydrogenase assembly factor FdhD